MSDTTDCAKRAVRIKALRAKADSTEFPAEAKSLREKADELQARNDALGYVDEPVTGNAFADAWEQFFGVDYRARVAEEKLKKYQEHIRQNEAKKARGDCLKCRPDAMCNECFVREYMSGDTRTDEKPRTGRFTTEHPPPTQRRRSSHAECYANGWHENSKAGRASCRRGRV